MKISRGAITYSGVSHGNPQDVQKPQQYGNFSEYALLEAVDWCTPDN